MICLSQEMRDVALLCVIRPIDPSHTVSMESRIVHDLGIFGEEWIDFANRLKQVYKRNTFAVDPYIPRVLSTDVLILSLARTWPARQVGWVRTSLQSRIRVPALSLSLVDHLMQCR